MLSFVFLFSFCYGFIWNNYKFAFEGNKPLDFNEKILVFAGQGDGRQGDLVEPMKYKNLSNGCQILYGKRLNYDLK